MAKAIRSQSYPRIQNEKDKFYGYLDVTILKDHSNKIDANKLKEVIVDAIKYANKKSSREILSIPEGLTNDELQVIYKRKGKELFDYFIRYCGDPASTAYDCLNKSYNKIARDNFRNRTIQKERMNSGWRSGFVLSLSEKFIAERIVAIKANTAIKMLSVSSFIFRSISFSDHYYGCSCKT